MKILIAPDTFKGSLDAIDVSNAIHRGIAKWNPNIECLVQPMADGGEGTLQILDEVLELDTIKATVCDPLFRPIQSHYKTHQRTAFIEMSLASGYELLSKQERNCLVTTSYGTGELILDAIEAGMKEIYLFIGGSATCEGGIGLARALGYRIENSKKKQIVPVGKNLINIKKISSKKLKFKPKKVDIHVVCDVKNKLYGKKGTAHVYAPQKGADEQGVELLDKGLRNLSQIISKDLKVNIADLSGGGAAGGIGAGAVAFLNAKMLSGFNTIADILHLEQKIKTVDWVITGEGRLDKQTTRGKVVSGISKLAKKNKLPLVVFAGSKEIDPKDFKKLEIKACDTILEHTDDLDDAMTNATKYLEQMALNFAKNHLPKGK